ncbi:MAG: CBS domain-containing protein [Bdellovibrionales bacterium]
MATAKDIMTPDPIVLESSTSIQEAVDLFTKHKISSAAVQSAMGDIAGSLTELGLVRALVLHQLQPEKYSKLAHCMELLVEGSFVEPKDSITTVIKMMIKSPTQRVMVKSEGRKIHGIISPKDMMRVLLAGKPEAEAVQTEIGKLGNAKLETK